MLGLDKDLLQAVLVLVELVVDLVEIVELDAVRNHLQRVQLALLDLPQKFLPVLVDGRLSISNETNSTLHQRSNVEVVGLRKLC